MSAFAKELSLTISTKRAVMSGSPPKRGLPATRLSGLKCTPLDMAQTDVLINLGVASAGVLLQTFVEGSPDILPGDVLNVTSVDRGVATPYTVTAKDYPIQAVASYPWRKTLYSLLIVEFLSENS